jgi:hypothetical protein
VSPFWRSTPSITIVAVTSLLRTTAVSSAVAAEIPMPAKPADVGISRAKIVSSDTRFDLNTFFFL